MYTYFVYKDKVFYLVCVSLNASIKSTFSGNIGQTIIYKHLRQTMTYFLQSPKVSRYDQEIPQSHSIDQPMSPRGRTTELKQAQNIGEKSITTTSATSSLFLSKLIKILEKTLSTSYQTRTKHKNPTNKTMNQQQQNHVL